MSDDIVVPQPKADEPEAIIRTYTTDTLEAFGIKLEWCNDDHVVAGPDVLFRISDYVVISLDDVEQGVVLIGDNGIDDVVVPIINRIVAELHAGTDAQAAVNLAISAAS